MFEMIFGTIAGALLAVAVLTVAGALCFAFWLTYDMITETFKDTK